MAVPVFLYKDLEQIPRDRPVGLLMRHSARFPIVDQSRHHLVGLTQEGVRMAEDFGASLGPHFNCGRLLSSPVGRCIDTANAVARGAGWPAKAVVDDQLGDLFIASAWDLVSTGRKNGTTPRQVQALLRLLLTDAGTPCLDVLVTHDTVVGAVTGCLLGAPVTGPDMPKFLEGLLVWRGENCIHARWRGFEKKLPDVYPVNRADN